MDGVNPIPHVGADDHAEGLTALRLHGVVAIDGAIAQERIDSLRDAVMARHPEFADKARLTDFQDNGEGRFIAPVAISRAVVESGLLHHPALAALAAGALGEDWVIDAFGMLMAFPGCSEQKPHRNGEALFPDAPLGSILPPFALTVLFPLVDVAADNGATAFLPGTQRYDAKLAAAPAAATSVVRGSFLVWDFETLHWGLPNSSDRARPALYLTLCRPFWMDTANFGGSSRIRLTVDEDVVPLLDRRFARATAGGGQWAHAGLGKALKKVAR